MADITAEEHGILWKRDEKQEEILDWKMVYASDRGAFFIAMLC